MIFKSTNFETYAGICINVRILHFLFIFFFLFLDAGSSSQTISTFLFPQYNISHNDLFSHLCKVFMCSHYFLVFFLFPVPKEHQRRRFLLLLEKIIKLIPNVV